jgi:tRNA 2-thiouridine synthesizing protein A
MEFDEDIDAAGLLCPLPVLKLRKRLQGMATGAVARLRADDPAARIDVPHFCNEAGHELVIVETDGKDRLFFVRKAP